MLEVLAVLIVLATVFSLLVSGRGHAFRPGLAQTRMQRVSGTNVASVLAIVGVASLVLEFAASSPLSRIPGIAPLIVSAVVILIVGIVVARSATELVLAVLGIGLLITTVGFSGALQLAILVALMIWILGIVRGFFA